MTMQPIVTYEPFSIVVVPFPFTDIHQTKRRPAIVISSTEHQSTTLHITLLMITTTKKSVWESDHEIIKLAETGLSTPSIIRQKLFTLDLRLILKQIGNLGNKDRQQLIKHLRQHLVLENTQLSR